MSPAITSCAPATRTVGWKRTFPGSGWVTFDPTPPSAGDSHGPVFPAGPVLRLVSAQLERVGHQLRFLASGPTGEKRPAKFHGLGGFSAPEIRALKRRSMNGLTAWQATHPRLSMVFPIALVFALVVLRFDWISALLRWLALSWQVRRAPTERNNPQLASRLYAELLAAT